MKKFLNSIFIIIGISGYAQVPTYTVTATEECLFSNPTELKCYSSLPNDSIAVWNWDMNNNGSYSDVDTDITVSVNKAYYFFKSAGTYTISLQVIKKNGGTDTIQKTVVVNPLPSVNFEVDNLCAFKEAVYHSKSTITTGSIDQFIWDFDANGVPDAPASGSNFLPLDDTVTYTCGPAQQYNTILECVSDKGCRTSSSPKSTDVYSQPTALFSVQSSCLNDTTRFINTTGIAAGNIYVWEFGDGTQETTYNSDHLYSSLIDYTVSLIVVSDHNCRDTAQQVITINPVPSVSFTYSGDTIFAEGGSLLITVNSTASNYFWSTGATTDNITVSVGGNYSVKATDVNGCTTIISTDIGVKGVKDVVTVLNDVLTPNNDGKNDLFIIDDLSFYTSCSISIYNRWNEKIYSAAKYNNDWDGTLNGHLLDAGTYFYIIMCDGKTQTTGSINILR